MRVVRVFNNNVVLAHDEDGGEVILTGRGLGFQAKPGSVVDPARIARTFIPADGRDPDHLAQLLAGIPPEHVHLVGAALAEAGLEDRASQMPTLVIALADHVSFALKRVEQGVDLEYPLLAEVKNLYAEEYAQAEALRQAINRHVDHALPDGETVALALHLVNSGFSSGDLSYTYTMTGVIQQMVSVIESSVGCELDMGSVSVGRFITHVRYLFVRIHQHKQLDQEHSPVGVAIREAYPDALACAARLASILELRLGSPLTEDEVSYLTLHVARVATSPR